MGFASAFAFGTVFCAAAAPPFDYKALRADIEKLLDDDLSVGPVLVRLAWHEAGTWDAKQRDGSPNSASMRFAPECKHAANAGLDKARNLLEPIKKKHPNVSYADLWALAGGIAVEAMGGPTIPFRWGRIDATESKVPDGRLPDASQGPQHVRDVFGRLGFNERDTVALIGAHAVGECHADRSGYVGPWTHDKLGFTNTFFTELLGNDWVIDKTKKKLQYTDLATRKLMMLPSDVALLYDPAYRKWVDKYAKDSDAFAADFSRAFQALLELGVSQNLKSL